MSKRRRINLSLREEAYNDLQKIVRDYHFKNACEVVTTLIGLFLEMKKHPPKRVRKGEPVDEDAQYIQDMFNDFETWEPQPEAGHAPVIKRPRRSRN